MEPGAHRLHCHVKCGQPGIEHFGIGVGDQLGRADHQFQEPVPQRRRDHDLQDDLRSQLPRDDPGSQPGRAVENFRRAGRVRAHCQCEDEYDEGDDAQSGQNPPHPPACRLGKFALEKLDGQRHEQERRGHQKRDEPALSLKSKVAGGVRDSQHAKKHQGDSEAPPSPTSRAARECAVVDGLRLRCPLQHLGDARVLGFKAAKLLGSGRLLGLELMQLGPPLAEEAVLHPLAGEDKAVGPVDGCRNGRFAEQFPAEAEADREHLAGDGADKPRFGLFARCRN